MSTDHIGPYGAIRSWSLALVAALVLALLPFAGTALAQEEAADPTDACPDDPPPADYADRDDIPEVHVRNVDCVTYRNIAFGFQDNTYRPRLNVRRDQMASFIARTVEEAGHELPPPESHPGFVDTQGNTHEDRIRQLAAAGIVQGGPGELPPTHYGPERDVRRDQMTSFLIRSAEYAHDEDFGEDDQRFDDVPPTNPHFRNVNGAHERGLALGGPGGLPATQFGPSLSTRRDQMASFLARLLQFIETFDEEPDPTPDPTTDVTPPATPETTPAPTAEPTADASAGTGAPELVLVGATVTTTTAHVSYQFDEAVDTTTVQAGRFLLYGPNTTTQRFAGSSAAAQGDTVVVEFTRAQYDQATTAAVMNDAIRDTGGMANPEKALGLKSATVAGTTYPAGDVFGPRLIFARFTTQGPATNITWVFDQDVTRSTGTGAGALVLYMADGSRVTEPGGFPHGTWGNCTVAGREITCQGIFASTPALAAVTHNAVRNLPANTVSGATYPNYEQARRIVAG